MRWRDVFYHKLRFCGNNLFVRIFHVAPKSMPSKRFIWGLIPFLQLLRFQFNTERKNTCRARKGKVQTSPCSKNFGISDHSIAWSQQISFKSLGRGWLEKDIPLLPSSRFLYPEDMIRLAIKSQSSKLMMVELDDSKRAQKS